MIYTLTLNPALDYVIQVDSFAAGKINRTKTENIYAGGKGINVSTILRELGFESTALGFTAGFTGNALKESLAAKGIVCDFVEAGKGMTRINVKMKSDEETEINGTGPDISEEEFRQLTEKIAKLHEGDMLIISGSIPKCLADDTYEKILECTDSSVRIIADAEKSLLLKILRFRPFLIKPNILELAQMFDTEITSDEEVVVYAKKLQEMGACNVLVSMAKDGALLVDENQNVYRIGVAKGTVVNSVGAGDSMVAGFIGGYLKTGDYAYALKLATACGGATAFHSDLATGQQIEEVLKTL